eukprot:CAMPEP_0183481202 /NCGR_PEP_ID=MMETSP0370-20130417/174514_1 /TAXON_ID=268820 /ORGANISM="Peridinium aciculiferum, Strain PAER-2" /LENGTH=138 /DNA_ID=CAMNT_0025674315 /DNA_START=85 /DNA_END=501 /DNA_ORIENTATION=+
MCEHSTAWVLQEQHDVYVNRALEVNIGVEAPQDVSPDGHTSGDGHVRLIGRMQSIDQSLDQAWGDGHVAVRNDLCHAPSPKPRGLEHTHRQGVPNVLDKEAAPAGGHRQEVPIPNFDLGGAGHGQRRRERRAEIRMPI